MRAYDIVIKQPNSTAIFRQYTSLGAGNTNNPAALDIALDAFVYSYDESGQQPAVQIRGVPIADIQQAANFAGCSITISAGFQTGLPLNKPAQYGKIIQGTIYQSFANWVGTEQSLDFVITLTGAVSGNPSNIAFLWKANTPLSQALATTFTNAFPGIKQTIQVSDKLVTNSDKVGAYTTLPAFSQMLKALTQPIIGGSYLGVSVAATATGILAQDGTVKPAAIDLAFEDLIGQPTWIGPGPNVIQFVCPMRYDLSVNSLVKMPQGILGNQNNPYGVPGTVTTTAASSPQARQQSIFNGQFSVTKVHHIGAFRDPGPLSWVTVYNAVTQTT